MEYDPAAASPCFVNQPTEPRDVKHYDPWKDHDPYMGQARPIEDISQVDFGDAEFRQFALSKINTHTRKPVIKTVTEKWAVREVILGSSDE
jgi:hypothetical protein